MKLINRAKDKMLASNVKIADGFFSRLKGLLGTVSLPYGQCLVICPCSSVHTFGMRYAIDVLFVNKHNTVVKVVKAMQPGSMAAAWGSAYVVELPSGAAALTEAGDIVKFVE